MTHAVSVEVQTFPALTFPCLGAHFSVSKARFSVSRSVVALPICHVVSLHALSLSERCDSEISHNIDTGAVT